MSLPLLPRWLHDRFSVCGSRVALEILGDLSQATFSACALPVQLGGVKRRRMHDCVKNHPPQFWGEIRHAWFPVSDGSSGGHKMFLLLMMASISRCLTYCNTVLASVKRNPVAVRRRGSRRYAFEMTRRRCYARARRSNSWRGETTNSRGGQCFRLPVTKNAFCVCRDSALS